MGENNNQRVTKEELGMLTKDEYQKCLAAADISTFLDVHTVEEPKSIFIVGQPGAGKTALKSFVLAEKQNNGSFSTFIEFNPDVISTHHANYAQIIENYPDEAYLILQNSFTRTALDDYLRPRAVHIRCNIVQEGTFGSTAGYLKIIEFQQQGGLAPIGEVLHDGSRQLKNVNGGYEVEIDVLAVDRFSSLLSCFEREQYFIDNGLPARVVIKEHHDRAYQSMLTTIDEIQSRKLFDTFKVYKRGSIQEKPELLYMIGNSSLSSVSQFIKCERERQEMELFEHPEPFIDKMQKLMMRASKGGNKFLLGRLQEFEREFYTELKKDKSYGLFIPREER